MCSIASGIYNSGRNVLLSYHYADDIGYRSGLYDVCEHFSTMNRTFQATANYGVPKISGSGLLISGPDITSTVQRYSGAVTPRTRTITSTWTHLCPELDLQYVEDFLKWCRETFSELSIRNTAVIPNCNDASECHQLCTENPLRRAWEDTDEPTFFGSLCYHYLEALSPKANILFLATGLLHSAGARGFCYLLLLRPGTTPMAPSATTDTVSPFASAFMMTIPTSTSGLCPYLEGRCGNGAYIRCGRNLYGDANRTTWNFDCVMQPDIEEEKTCHDACILDRTCTGWAGYDEVDHLFSSPTFTRCHVHEFAALKRPPLNKTSSSPFAYLSCGLKLACPALVANLCPAAENRCVDGFLIQCGRDLRSDAASGFGERVFRPEILENLTCHQACAEDPECNAWYGEVEFADADFGGGGVFECFHALDQTVVLKSDLPEVSRGLDKCYGVRNICCR